MTDTTTTRAKRAHGAGSVYKRKGAACYSIRWTDAQGRRHSKPTRCTVERDAEKLLRAELAKVDRGEPGNADAVTFEDLVKLYRDRRAADGLRFDPTWALRHLAASFAGRKARSITGADVLAYEVKRRAEGASHSTLNGELAALRRMYRLGVAMRLISADHMPAITIRIPQNAREGFFSAADFEALAAELPEYLAPMMTFCYITGWRCKSEVATLRWSQVDFNAGTVSLPAGATKSGKPRVFPFHAHEPLKRLLEGQRDAAKVAGAITPWVFPGRDGKQIRDYRAAWAAALDRAAHGGKGPREPMRVLERPELVGKLVHDLRRSAARNLIRAGVSRDVAMQLTGHETPHIFSRYNITTGDDLSDAVAKLAGSYQSVPKDTRAQVSTGVHSGGGRVARAERTA